MRISDWSSDVCSSDLAGDQGLLLRRPALALEEAARDLPRGEGLLLVVHGEREEIGTRPRRSLADGGAQHHGVAIGRQDSAIGLTRAAAGLQGQLAAAPLDLLLIDVKHAFLGPSNHYLPLPTPPDGPVQIGTPSCRAR